MKLKLSLFLFCTFLKSSFAADWTITLEYSVNDFMNSYPLGSIELRRSFDGNYTGTFKPTKEKDLGAKLLTAQDGLYSVRAKSSSQPGETFLTTSDPCLFLQSSLWHLFYVAINPENEKLKTITLFPDSVALKNYEDSVIKGAFPPGTSCQERTANIQPPLEERVEAGTPKGVVIVSGRTSLPSPDTAFFVQKLEREKRAKQHGADADNRGFIAKYWMYIVPVVIFALISNAVNPEAGAEGGGGAQ